jgi:RNA polymerase sigma-70 factor
MTQINAEPSDYSRFLELYSRNRDRLFGYIYAMLPHQADAEDVFQRASLVLWNKFSGYDPERPFLPWACSLAHYEVLNFIRSSNRDRLQFDEGLLDKLAEARSVQFDLGEERLEALRACLQRLKKAERDLIDLAYSGDKTIKEFVESTGGAAQTMYNRISLARRKLLACVKRKLAQQGLAT